MRLSKPLFWLLALLWFVAGIWWYGSCSKCTTCNTATAIPTTTEKTALPGFNVSDSNWNVSSTDNLRFGKSGNTPVLSTAIAADLDSIANYAKAHPNKTITVTGHYNATEKNGTTFENLGLARANELKKLLVAKGVAEKNIALNSQLDDALVFSPADTLVGGITMAFNNLKEDLFSAHTVYFNTAKNSLPIDAAFTKYISDAKTYLQNHADKKLMVTGYTDNVGDAAKNVTLSQGRANFVKSEFVKQGFIADKIISNGKGMNEPVADNNTEDGRAKNRRVTIQLQQ